MSKKSLLISSLVVVGILVIVFFVRRSDTTPYTSETVQRKNIVQEVSASGTVEPEARINLQFKNSGKIVLLPVTVGQKVVAGEIVARQDTGLLDSQLRQSQANLRAQEHKLESIKENRKINYDETYDIRAQKSVVEQASADIEAQQAKWKETILTAPIDGLITAVNSEIGEIAKPETTVISLISSGDLQVDVFVSETTIANVRIGQSARITLDAFDDGTEWSGMVAKIDPAELTRGGAIYYKTTLLFNTKDERIKPGMTANAWIRTAVSENTLFVPLSAIQKKDTEKIVRVLREDQVVETEVETGLKDANGMIEITSGLSEGDRVILRNDS